MSALHINVSFVLSLCHKLSKLVKIWRISGKNNFAQFFETRLIVSTHSLIHFLQARDSLLRSIVSEPKNYNYVYAPTFESLAQVRQIAQVRQVVVNNSCDPMSTSTPSTSQSTPTLSTPTPIIPSANGIKQRHYFPVHFLARDAQAKLALIVAQCLSIHLSICVSVRDSLSHAYVHTHLLYLAARRLDQHENNINKK